MGWEEVLEKVLPIAIVGGMMIFLFSQIKIKPPKMVEIVDYELE